MNMQVIFDKDSLDYYLSKYISKDDMSIDMSLLLSLKDYFRVREVGIAEAVYNLLGFHTQ